MRVRDHVALSTIASAVLSPRLGPGRTAGLWAGSVLIDADHFLWYSMHERSVDPRATLRFFNGADVPRHRGVRVLHSPVAVAVVGGLGMRRPWLRSVAMGMGVHVALDSGYERRMNRARAAALERDGYACIACGKHSGAVVTHLWNQPPLLPDFRPTNLVALCHECHRFAHNGGEAAQS